MASPAYYERVGFRNDVEAAHARARALERELSEVKRDNARLREELGQASVRLFELEAREPVPEPAVPLPSPELLQRRANRAVVLMAISLLLCVASSWLGHVTDFVWWLSALLTYSSWLLLALFVGLVLRSLFVCQQLMDTFTSREGQRGPNSWLLFLISLGLPFFGGFASLVLLSRHAARVGEKSESFRPIAAFSLILSFLGPVLIASVFFTSFGRPPAGMMVREERFQGRVMRASGDLGIVSGQQCRLVAEPRYDTSHLGLDCHLDVSCDSIPLFQGLARCVARSGDLAEARTPQSGDQRGVDVELDIGSGYITVVDRGPRPFDIAITLDTD